MTPLITTLRRPVSIAALFVLGLCPIASGRAAAEDMPSFRIEMRGTTITPSRLEVPADRPFKLEITNAGSDPAEFESVALHKEKVLAAGATSSLVFRRLPAGEYDFFDDFHPEAKAVLVAR
jgi:Cupredoxin-like domain